MQSEAGYPSVFRLSDPEETNIMLHMYNVIDSPVRHLFKLKGFEEGKDVPLPRLYQRGEGVFEESG